MKFLQQLHIFSRKWLRDEKFTQIVVAFTVVFLYNNSMEIWSKIDIDAVRGKRVLVALSGGVDSVALLSLLTEMRKQGGFEVFAGHVEHGIRGDESCRDALFCQALCERLGVELLTTHVDVPAYASANNMGPETAARTLRSDALRKMKATCGAEVIALGHDA
ncbi:MAG: hypothetical protein MJ099_03285, partial [Clostridia bacterium]|nr:hypothetical protein [Clostridia bacterium]